MAGYQGRKGPNISQYIANLNEIPSAPADAADDNHYSIDAELAQFTNTEFLDFDAGNFLDRNVSELGSEGREADEVKGLEFVDDTFPFGDINSFLPQDTQSIPPSVSTGYPIPTTISSPIYPGSTSPLDFNAPPLPTPPSTHAQPPQETAASHLVAEEDKRRRNTAASARFRVKKKQREQALESTAKELENKTLALEQRIGQLETENEWLRGLVVEKHGGEREDLRLRWKGGKEGRSSEGGKKGVGTEVKGVENA